MSHSANSSYRFQAERTALRSAQGLGEIEPIARAELKLRRLAILCLESASKRFRKAIRLPQWYDEISLVTFEYEATLKAWNDWKQKPF